ARILAKAINCQEGEPGTPCNRCRSCTEIRSGSSVDVQEIDGASNRGIDEIRELRENIKYMPSSSRFRVYIIDEVHMLTLHAFNAILKTLEEPPPHVKFIFATTEPHKVPVTILSRCQRFDFKRIPLSRIVAHLERIAGEEGIEVGRSGLTLIAGEAEGSMRDAESLLDQVVSFTGPKVGDKDITDILGIIDRELIFETSLAIIEGAPGKCMDIVDRIYNFGYDIKEFYRTLMDQFRNLLISQVAPEGDLLDMIDRDRQELSRQAEKAGVERLQQALNVLITREEDLRFSSHPRLVLETVMIKLCRLGEILSFDELIRKIEAIEKRLSSRPPARTGRPEGRLSDPGTPYGGQGEEKKEVGIPEEPTLSASWDEFLNRVASGNRAMANVLRDWKPVVLTEDTLELERGSNPFSASYFDDPERLAKLQEHCRNFYQRDLTVRLMGDGPGARQDAGRAAEIHVHPRQKHQRDLPPAVRDILEVFQGEIQETPPPGRDLEGKKAKTGNKRRTKS
ncbi:MAG: DNA polymerase III subunit gamma/tau, partial [Deltaproteobacteria bacterium]|nr:DNA polymerase III subunit gamma/tau [Deltaproteobacteria bacterium]